MTARAKTHRGLYIAPSILLVFMFLVSFIFISSMFYANNITSTDIIIAFLAVVSTFGLGLFCYAGLRSGKKPRDLPRVIRWFSWASMAIAALAILEVILILLFTTH